MHIFINRKLKFYSANIIIRKNKNDNYNIFKFKTYENVVRARFTSTMSVSTSQTTHLSFLCLLSFFLRFHSGSK